MFHEQEQSGDKTKLITDRHCRPVAAEAVYNLIVEQNALIGFVKDSDHILTLTAN